METTEKVKLTSYSHGAGCGCKIAPAVLSSILKGNESSLEFPELLVGNDKRDDAAVYKINDQQAVISTTDFFMPIVDDPFDFGRIAATNAISDVYAMGGTPFLAIAILGWPVNKLAPEIAGRVLAGARKVCDDAGIALGGGHSIDCPEPVFGLAVNGLIHPDEIKHNSEARVGDKLFLTKRIGVGILSTASKKSLLNKQHLNTAVDSMTTSNKIGADLGKKEWIHAITDVTGFGLLGHLNEMAQGSKLTAAISFEKVPLIDDLDNYLDQNCVPGGTNRNWDSYGANIGEIDLRTRNILCDPQTSGGLLVSVHPDHVEDYKTLMKDKGMPEFCLEEIGYFKDSGNFTVEVQ